MKCPNCQAEINDSAKFCPECGQEVKKSYIWLTIPNCSHSKKIKIQSGDTSKDGVENEIWFEDNQENRTKAEALLIEIKKTIFRMCKDNPNFKSWLTEEWVNTANKWN